MSTPDQRARDKDRDAAIEIVEAAWADGQIVEADRDRRVEELLRAQTLAEIRMHTHDLQVPATVTAVPNPYGPAPVHPTVEPLPAAAPSRTSAVGCLGALVVLVVVTAVIGVVVAAIAAISSGVDDAIDFGTSPSATATPLPGAAVDEGVNALSEEGYREFLDDLEAARGSTDGFEVVIYPGYAVAYLPVDATSQRYSLWYWNGEMDDLDSRGTTDYERFDLADVDMQVVVRLVKRVRGMVEDPSSFYAIVRAPAADDGQAIAVYASNEYSESAFLLATMEGKVVYRSTDK